MILPTSSWRWIFRLVFLPFGLCLTLLLIESIFIFLYGTYFNFKHIVGVWLLIPSSNRIWVRRFWANAVIVEGSWQDNLPMLASTCHIYIWTKLCFPWPNNARVTTVFKSSDGLRNMCICRALRWCGPNRTMRFLKVMADKQAKKRIFHSHRRIPYIESDIRSKSGGSSGFPFFSTLAWN